MKRFLMSRLDGAASASNLANSPQVSASEHSAFIEYPVFRSGPSAYRMVYVGELTPRSGVLDFFSCSANWADANPSVSVEIIWLGDGDLRGILRAQPAPKNLKQSFDPIPDAMGLAAIFAQCGLMAVPYLTDLPFSWLPEAMATGLPVLGSRRASGVRQLVTQGLTGWLFDPRREEELAHAFSEALTATTEQLNTMRMAARERVSAAFTGSYVSEPAPEMKDIRGAMANGAVA